MEPWSCYYQGEDATNPAVGKRGPQAAPRRGWGVAP
jgi:hypothetical protein